MGAPKTIHANRDRFIVRRIIVAPLAGTLKVGRRVGPPIGRNAATNDARKLRGTIEGSANVEPLTINTN